MEKKKAQDRRIFKVSLHLQTFMLYLTAFVHATILITWERNSINKAIMSVTMSFLKQASNSVIRLGTRLSGVINPEAITKESLHQTAY